MSISALITAASDRLTPTERRIAKAVLADPTLLAFGTVSDLADRVGTSRPSIVRFANKLGLDGYTQLQDEARSAVSEQLSRPSQRIRHEDESLSASRAAVESCLGAAFEALDGGRLTELARAIAGAKNVWILSGETSRAGAYVFLSGLSIVRPGVRLVEEHSSGRDLASALPGDVAVVFDFARYRRHAITAARALHEQGVELVAITDGPFSPLASLTELWCELRVPAIGPFDSSLPAVATAELLVAQVANELRDDARARIDRTEASWAAIGTFLS